MNCTRCTYQPEDLIILQARITLVQRNAMLNFIMAHPSLSTGKFVSGEGDRLKAQMADVLNNIEGGAVKSPEKWFRVSNIRIIIYLGT